MLIEQLLVAGGGAACPSLGVFDQLVGAHPELVTVDGQQGVQLRGQDVAR
ncbi:hypothetical protein ACWF82_22915 [Nocardia sp. NPDC055053]